ncbi:MULTISPECIES: outer membrane lipoprotein chaperone LolA [unclassified Vibrio]|uniref:Outer-membrane lipoprotein carrier protein n=1 Tax=Vibrio sp. HB236076 TaxID=3232307 RepID=A0AB39HE95_9VIBR|nr:outer membrane lipoprotein chaperone LolA [Vibrio sp. HB161653]MDP5253666.1 outer membrane lipoprotein chaperone LolA [Vibrio sp. HB161653]
MKKWWLLLLVSTSALANPQQELSKRLSSTEGFSAHFDQQVISPEGDVIMQGEGEVDVARPSLFRWHTQSPDETVLVSNGKTLWYYSPFVEQVTLYNPDQATAQTPFILLTRNQDSDWQQYQVSQKQDTFTLVSKEKSQSGSQYQITISAKGLVDQFKVIEQDGQTSTFDFSQFNNGYQDTSRYNFNVPKGVDIDDQRQ